MHHHHFYVVDEDRLINVPADAVTIPAGYELMSIRCRCWQAGALGFGCRLPG